MYSLFQLNFKPCIYLYFCRYPVILSIENHCSVKQQTVMATYIRSIFGGNTDVFIYSTQIIIESWRRTDKAYTVILYIILETNMHTVLQK